jgi:hypothetical protein
MLALICENSFEDIGWDSLEEIFPQIDKLNRPDPAPVPDPAHGLYLFGTNFDDNITSLTKTGNESVRFRIYSFDKIHRQTLGQATIKQKPK